MRPANKINTQLNYAGMMWLLAAQVAVMLPFLFHLPFWLIAVLLLSTIWRIRVLRGHWAQPSLGMKIAVIVTGLSLLAISGLKPFSLDLTTSFLLLGFAFKSLELITRRDAVVVVFTGFFLTSMQFLYSQSIGAAAYGVICLTLLTATLIAVQYNRQNNTAHHLKLAGVMLAQCLPLMIALYLFFPRLPPIWAIALPSDQATTGISDTMAPGDIANLSQSDEPAFRVSFKDPRPPQNQLYWRGLTLQHFDGRSWQQFDQNYSDFQLGRKLRVNQNLLYSRNNSTNNILSYFVVYEPTNQNWLFTLSPVSKLSGAAYTGFDYRLIAKEPLSAALILRLSSDMSATLNYQPTQSELDFSLQLPTDQNPRTHDLAKKWRAESISDLQYAQNVMRFFREQEFHYTLRPPLTGSTDTIDAFLFDSQRGFCSHYAGSFTYMMRAAGIPARVVVGYQGGEWNEKSSYLTVYQYDAHAWTEVWLGKESGWVRFDPTAMVAPTRIEQNLQVAVRQEGSFLEKNRFSSKHVEWLSGMRKRWDAVQYGWRRWVLGYDATHQSELLEKWLGEVSIARIAVVFGSLIFIIVMTWALFLGFFRFKTEPSATKRIYKKLCKKLEKRGLARPIATTPNEYAKLAAEKFPENAKWILEASKLFERLNYTHQTPEQQKQLLEQFKQAVKHA